MPAGVTPRIVHEAARIWALIGMVEAGLGCALVPPPRRRGRRGTARPATAAQDRAADTARAALLRELRAALKAKLAENLRFERSGAFGKR